MMRERTPGNVASLTPRLARRLQITRGTRNARYRYRGGEGAAHDFLRVQEGRTGSRIAALVPGGCTGSRRAAPRERGAPRASCEVGPMDVTDRHARPGMELAVAAAWTLILM
jgi:hypothetical protein